MLEMEINQTISWKIEHNLCMYFYPQNMCTMLKIEAVLNVAESHFFN